MFKISVFLSVTLLKAQLEVIQNIGLSKVICTMMKPRNDEDDDVVHWGANTKKEPFKKNSESIDCGTLGGFDFSPWREFPEELNICGEDSFSKYSYDAYNASYIGFSADGKYIRKQDAATGKIYYESEPTSYFLWYDSAEYNWVLSRSLFDADTAQSSKFIS